MQAGVCQGTKDIRKGVYWRFVLGSQESCKFTNIDAKNEATVDAQCWICIFAELAISIFGVGFCVARSTSMGNARASESGTSNNIRLPRFFCLWFSSVGSPWELNCFVMSSELRAEFDSLEWHYVKPFANRWKSKIRKTKLVDDKQYEFDAFIANYLIYAAMVNVIKPREHKTKEDKAYCTRIMANFILRNTSNELLLIQNLSTPATKLGETIKNYQFYVVSSRNENPELEAKWKHGSIEEKLLSLLQILYYMRCNIFHGNKEYADDQVLLLSPANNCLNILIKEIQQIFNNHD